MGTSEARSRPLKLARVGGLLYVVIIVGGIVGEGLIRGGLIVPGDPTATAQNIRASEQLWRAGAASELFMLVCSVVVTLVLYVLLRPVSKDLALLAVFFNLVTIAMEATNELHLLATLIPLEGAGHLGAFGTDQLDALAYVPLTLYGYGFGNDLIFFGVACLALGALIYRSGYLPKAIGLLMTLAGLGYLVNSFALILSPALAAVLFPAVLLPAVVGEGSLALWLLSKGVDVAGFEAAAGGAGSAGFSIPPTG